MALNGTGIEFGKSEHDGRCGKLVELQLHQRTL
jgi:hypothetical protein